MRRLKRFVLRELPRDILVAAFTALFVWGALVLADGSGRRGSPARESTPPLARPAAAAPAPVPTLRPAEGRISGVPRAVEEGVLRSIREGEMTYDEAYGLYRRHVAAGDLPMGLRPAGGSGPAGR